LRWALIYVEDDRNHSIISLLLVISHSSFSDHQRGSGADFEFVFVIKIANMVAAKFKFITTDNAA